MFKIVDAPVNDDDNEGNRHALIFFSQCYKVARYVEYIFDEYSE